MPMRHTVLRLIGSMLAAWPVTQAAVAEDIDTAWIRIYNGPSGLSDAALDVAVDDDGYAYVTGYSQHPVGMFNPRHVVVIKYTPDGDTVWLRKSLTAGASIEEGRVMKLTGDGHLMIAGWGNTVGMRVLKYTTDGDTVWTRTFAGVVPNDMALNSSGDVWITGGNSSDWVTVHYDASGTYQWDDTFADAGGGPDTPFGIEVDAADNAYVVGTGEGTLANQDILTIKYNSSGGIDWTRRYNGPANLNDAGARVAIADANTIYVCGVSLNASFDNDIVLIRYEADGDTAWTRRFVGAGTGADVVGDMDLDGNGNICLGGTVYTSGATSKAAVIKYDSDGDTLWARFISPSVNIREVEADANGDIYLTGEAYPTGSFWTDWATFKFTAAGDSAWFRWLLNGTLPIFSQVCRAIELDGSGGVLICGNTAGNSGDFAVAKYVPPCSCPCHADPACNGVTDVFDVVAAVDVAFRSGTPVFDADCPNEQTDVTCDNVTNVFDVVAFVDVAFRNGSPSQFCDPCS